MRLKSIELTGFKSFAKKTTLNFKSSITAIVGPNGSGKSNVAEAFRFALGEQSIKSMRGKRTEDLIWNGSPKVPRSNRASVHLTLNNEDNLIDVDFDEVTLGRVIHRDASNEYLLNGSQVRLKDITELVTEANIGGAGYHIISQGESDRILNVSSKERKPIIEDALGLRIYHYRITKAQKKLETTDDNIEKVESLRRELAPHLKFLKKQVEKIEKTKVLREELKKIYLEYFAREDTYIKSNKDEIEKQIVVPQRELEEVEVQINKAKELSEGRPEVDAKIDELGKLDDRIDAKRKSREEISRRAGRLEGEISTLEKSYERLQKKEHQKGIYIEVNDIQDLEGQIVDAVEESSDSSTASIKERIKELFDKFIMSLQRDEGGSTAHEIEEETESKKSSLQKIRQETKALSEEIEALLEDRKVLQRKIEEEKDRYKDAEMEVFKLGAKRSELKSKVDDLKNKREELKHLERDLKQDLGEAGALLGAETVRYEDYELTGEDGQVLTKEDILKENRDNQRERRKEIERLRIRIEESGGSGGGEVLKEYKNTKERDEYLEEELDDLYSSKEKLQGIMSELEETLDTRFEEGLKTINQEFQKLFELMFGGGKAKLSLETLNSSEDSEVDEFEEEGRSAVGVLIDVSLPRKKIRGLEMLSGGERALTSIALLFAMSQVNPPPFLILDETDAALDEANSRKYGDMIEALSSDSQLVLITHNRETMSRAGMLYGVTMGGDGSSRLLSVKFDEAVKVAK